MPFLADERPDPFAVATAPRVIFVLGKGGVGRSTVAAALGLRLSGRGERVLVLEWSLAERIAPWFGLPPAGPAPVEIGPGLAVASFDLADALRRYFVDHLHLPRLHRRVISGGPIARLLAAAPGLAEMFFLGELWWLTTLAEREAGLAFDRVIVDAPATGHAASLLEVPATLSRMAAAGLLATETGRVLQMLGDPAWSGVLVVTLPEPLVVAETLELVPRVTARLGRPPLAILVNASAAALGSHADVDLLQLSPPGRAALAAVAEELRDRAAVEDDLRHRTSLPVVSLPDLPDLAPAGVARALAGLS